PACPLPFPHRGDSTIGKGHSLAEEIEHGERLVQQMDAVRRRREAKLHVAKEVLARRRSLAEAIGRFRELDQDWLLCRLVGQKAEDFGRSEDEGDGRRVINYVREILDDRPDEAAAVVGRLDKELQQLLADQKKRLPAPAEPRTK